MKHMGNWIWLRSSLRDPVSYNRSIRWHLDWIQTLETNSPLARSIFQSPKRRLSWPRHVSIHTWPNYFWNAVELFLRIHIDFTVVKPIFRFDQWVEEKANQLSFISASLQKWANWSRKDGICLRGFMSQGYDSSMWFFWRSKHHNKGSDTAATPTISQLFGTAIFLFGESFWFIFNVGWAGDSSTILVCTLYFWLGDLRPTVIRGNTSHWESTLAVCSPSIPPKAIYSPYIYMVYMYIYIPGAWVTPVLIKGLYNEFAYIWYIHSTPLWKKHALS